MIIIWNNNNYYNQYYYNQLFEKNVVWVGLKPKAHQNEIKIKCLDVILLHLYFKYKHVGLV